MEHLGCWVKQIFNLTWISLELLVVVSQLDVYIEQWMEQNIDKVRSLVEIFFAECFDLDKFLENENA